MSGPTLAGVATRRLSPREIETLDAAGDGLTTRQIGRRLNVSPASVRTYLANAALKLGSGDRAALVAGALRDGYLPRRRPPIQAVLAARPGPEHVRALVLVACGWPTERIALFEGVSFGVVKGRVRWWFTHFGARNRAHAVRLAVDAGVLPLRGLGVEPRDPQATLDQEAQAPA